MNTVVLGPAGLSLNVGPTCVIFTGLGAFSPSGLDHLHGHVVRITATLPGCYAIAGSRATERILAAAITVRQREATA